MKKPRLLYLPAAKEAVRKLTPAIKPIIKEGIERLLDDPYIGKELIEELAGFRSLVIGKPLFKNNRNIERPWMA